MTALLVLAVLGAFAAGAAIGWLLHSVRGGADLQPAHAEIARLRAQLDTARLDTTQLRTADFARQQSLEAVVAPLRTTLDRVQDQLRDVDRQRSGTQAALSEQIQAMRHSSESLRLQTGHLVTALRAPQVRGRWGEMQLERVVEAAGLTEHVDYVTQPSVTTPDGTVRPDLVVRLVGGKQVVVDAKVAFSAYLQALDAPDEAAAAERMRAHARQLRTHVDSLSAKEYWRRFTPAPEFVVCFVPADAFLDAALREDAALLEHAFARDVVLATPSTLVALLRTVAYTWRQDALAANAAEVHQLGRELYTRLSTMGAHVDKLGRSLGAAVEAYNGTVGSLESRVLVSARRLADLKVVGPTERLDPLEPITVATRAVQADELASRRFHPLSRQEVPPTGSDT